MALTLRRRPNDALRLHELSNLAIRARVPTVVTNDVLFHVPDRRILQDVVTCIRHNVTIDEAGFRRERHADRYLKPPDEMTRLFSRYPEALARTIEIAERCRFSLNELAYQYPDEATIPGLTPRRPNRSRRRAPERGHGRRAARHRDFRSRRIIFSSGVAHGQNDRRSALVQINPNIAESSKR
jgi:DNA polymerase III alpha subunit